MNTRVNKAKIRRKNRYKRRRILKRKRETSINIGCPTTFNFTQHLNSFVNRSEMTENMWNQSRGTMQEWHHKHEIAYWKSKAEALKYENQILHNIIQNMYCNNAGQSINVNRKLNIKEEEDSESETEENLEISEEFLSYLKVNMEHKMELEKSREKDEESVPAPTQPVDAERNEEMKLLYGKSANLIMGLETKVNLNYDSFKDHNKPVYWPYFPLNPWN